MKVLRRLYRYLRALQSVGVVAFGSMIVFAADADGARSALVQPIVDDVLTPPGVQVATHGRTRLSERIVDASAARLPEGSAAGCQRVDRTAQRFERVVERRSVAEVRSAC